MHKVRTHTLECAQPHMCVCTQSHGCVHTHRHTHSSARTHSSTHTSTCTLTDVHTWVHTHRRTHLGARALRNTRVHVHSDTHTHRHPHTRVCTHSDMRVRAHIHMCAHSDTHTLALTCRCFSLSPPHRALVRVALVRFIAASPSAFCPGYLPRPFCLRSPQHRVLSLILSSQALGASSCPRMTFPDCLRHHSLHSAVRPACLGILPADFMPIALGQAPWPFCASGFLFIGGSNGDSTEPMVWL